MIFITGDIHGHNDIKKLNSKNFDIGKNLTKDDYVIILGDFGLVWNNDKQDIYWRNWLTDKPWTTLFIDGNHENFDLLYQFPKVEMFNSTVSKITDSIFWLNRGNVYTINNYNFWVMGGARSTDIKNRKEGISWWPQEIPSLEEFNLGMNNTDKNIDFVLTHTAPISVINELKNNYLYLNCDDYFENKIDDVTYYLEEIYKNINFKKWFFGHFHIDKINIFNKFNAVYNEIIEF